MVGVCQKQQLHKRNLNYLTDHLDCLVSTDFNCTFIGIIHL